MMREINVDLTGVGVWSLVEVQSSELGISITPYVYDTEKECIDKMQKLIEISTRRCLIINDDEKIITSGITIKRHEIRYVSNEENSGVVTLVYDVREIYL